MLGIFMKEVKGLMRIFVPEVDPGVGGDRERWRGLWTEGVAVASRRSWRGGMGMKIWI